MFLYGTYVVARNNSLAVLGHVLKSVVNSLENENALMFKTTHKVRQPTSMQKQQVFYSAVCVHNHSRSFDLQVFFKCNKKQY